MRYRQVMGKEGLALAAVVSLAMAAVAFFISPSYSLDAVAGLCFPSPANWGLSAGLGWWFNIILLGATCALLSSLNKEYHIVPGSDTVALGMFLLMVTSNIWTSSMLTSTGIMAIANLVCIMMLFGCYDNRNATKDLFVIGTILSFGSMIQYGFVFMMPVYIIGAIILKCFNFKALTAYLMGIAAPYWIFIGFGIVDPQSISFPSLSHVFENIVSKSDLLIGVLNILFTALLGVVLTFLNSVKVYTGNSKKRACKTVLNVLGLFTLLCVIFDFENVMAYLATLYAITAVQMGNMFQSGNVTFSRYWLLGISALYITGFVLFCIY